MTYSPRLWVTHVLNCSSRMRRIPFVAMKPDWLTGIWHQRRPHVASHGGWSFSGLPQKASNTDTAELNDVLLFYFIFLPFIFLSPLTTFRTDDSFKCMSVIFSDCFRFIPGNNWFSHFSFVIFSFYESSTLRVLKDSPACELREAAARVRPTS